MIVTALLSYYSQYLRHDGNVRKLASEAARTDGEFECEWSYWIFGGRTRHSPHTELTIVLILFQRIVILLCLGWCLYILPSKM